MPDRDIAEEAAAWFARLSAPDVSLQSLRDFRTWRGDQANAAALVALQRLWKAAGDLADDPEIMAAVAAAQAAND